MKKTIILLTLIFVLFLSSTASAQDIVSVYINDTLLETDVPAVISDGSTMLPFRAVLNSLGVEDSEITWNEDVQSIEVKTIDKYIFLFVGNTAAIANDKLITLNKAPFIENGRTLVPIRFIAESLGANVEWNHDEYAVYITY